MNKVIIVAIALSSISSSTLAHGTPNGGHCYNNWHYAEAQLECSSRRGCQSYGDSCHKPHKPSKGLSSWIASWFSKEK